MPDKAICFLAVEGFADWEAAHALAVLRREGGYRIEVVGLGREPVVSMGGLRVVPSHTVADIDPADVAAFIIPGGDRWETAPVEDDLESMLRKLDELKVPIAAICGATVAICRIGLLRDRRHTSNGLRYLQSHVPGYTGASQYVDAPAVRDRGLITASGLANVEFAHALFEQLDVLSSGDRAVWAQMFRRGGLPDETA